MALNDFASALGYQATMLAGPYYSLPTTPDLIAHFRRIAAAQPTDHSVQPSGAKITGSPVHRFPTGRTCGAAWRCRPSKGLRLCAKNNAGDDAAVLSIGTRRYVKYGTELAGIHSAKRVRRCKR
jgi:hypothetical protein